jgi:hypothetical protein
MNPVSKFRDYRFHHPNIRTKSECYLGLEFSEILKWAILIIEPGGNDTILFASNILQVALHYLCFARRE